MKETKSKQRMRRRITECNTPKISRLPKSGVKFEFYKKWRKEWKKGGTVRPLELSHRHREQNLYIQDAQ